MGQNPLYTALLFQVALGVLCATFSGYMPCCDSDEIPLLESPEMKQFSSSASCEIHPARVSSKFRAKNDSLALKEGFRHPQGREAPT